MYALLNNQIIVEIFTVIMLFSLCVLFVVLVSNVSAKSKGNIVVWGSGSDLKLVTDDINCNYLDNSCYNAVKTLQQYGGNDLKYISFAPLDKNNKLNCNKINFKEIVKHDESNTIDNFVFGVYGNLDTTFQYVCDSHEQCFRTGCLLFEEYDIVWVSFGNDYYSKKEIDYDYAWDLYGGYGYPM